MDYRRYGEVLFDILIAGGLLVPGGSISQDGEMPYTKACIFAASEEMESMREQEQVRKLFLSELNQHQLEPVITDELNCELASNECERN